MAPDGRREIDINQKKVRDEQTEILALEISLNLNLKKKKCMKL